MKPLKQRLREIGLIEIHTGDVNERVWVAYKGKTTVMVHLTRGTTTFRIKVSKNGKDQNFVRHSDEEALTLLLNVLSNDLLQFYILCVIIIVCALAYAVSVLFT
jgi:hypothetical protein